MRKGTKKIRKVCTGLNEYYVYDLDEDILGKRKRLYARTEEELKAKIEEAAKEKRVQLSAHKPKSKKLKAYVQYYFRNAVGNIPSGEIKRLLLLFERIVFDSPIDMDVDQITERDITDFYSSLSDKFSYQSIKSVDSVLRKTFLIAREEGATDLDFNAIPEPDADSPSASMNYILSPEELSEMLKFCMDDNCTRYGSNELVIIFSMMTGLKFSQIKALRPESIDMEKGTVRLKERLSEVEVPMDAECVRWLKEKGEDTSINLSESGKPVFFNSRGVSPTLQSIQSTVNSIAQRCGLPKDVTGKSLFKAYIIKELESGVSEEELAKKFGRKKAYITNIKDEYEVKKLLMG